MAAAAERRDRGLEPAVRLARRDVERRGRRLAQADSARPLRLDVKRRRDPAREMPPQVAPHLRAATHRERVGPDRAEESERGERADDRRGERREDRDRGQDSGARARRSSRHRHLAERGAHRVGAAIPLELASGVSTSRWASTAVAMPPTSSGVT